MPEAGLLGQIVLLQFIVVVVVVYALKCFLERDLVRAAFERAAGLQPSEELRNTERILVISASQLSADWRGRFTTVLQSKFPRAVISFLENADLKGGLVVEIGEEVWDFSLTTTLSRLWH